METRIKISGEEVSSYKLDNLCDGWEDASFEIVKTESGGLEIQFKGYGITIPKKELVKILKFLIDERELKEIPPFAFQWDGEKYRDTND